MRTGSLKSAADALAITPAAVGQRIKALEDYLGIDLLVRGRSGLRPTPALAEALAHLGTAFRELDAAAESLDLQRGHEIQIAAASDFADLWLKPRLQSFHAAHPNLLFCINSEGEAPMRIGRVDCEINFGAPRRGWEILFRDLIVPVTSRENTRRLSALAKRDRLEGFPLLHLDFYKNDPAALSWASWAAAHKVKRTAPERGIRFQRITAALEAVLANAGTTLCGLALISAYVEDGEVAQPFPDSAGAWTEHAFQVRFRDEALARAHVRRFRDWLLAEGAATAEWLARRAKPHRSRKA